MGGLNYVNFKVFGTSIATIFKLFITIIEVILEFLFIFTAERKFSMKIDKDLINKLAELAKLEFNDEDAAEIQLNLGKILDLVEQLKAVDTTGVAPLIYMNENINVFRDDLVKQSITKEEGLMNAPDKDSDYIKVPKVISKWILLNFEK